MVRVLVYSIVCFLLSGCLSSGVGDIRPQDPYEKFNRKSFQFSESVDKKLLAPVAHGYSRILPDPLETGFNNLFVNINSVPSSVNGLLQGQIEVGAREQKARDKALKTLQKDYDKKTKRERNRDRNALDKLPFGEVIGAEVSFHKVAFTDVTKFLIDNKIPFEITSYEMTYREDMQWEIDEEKRIKHYDNVEEEYHNLYHSNDNEEEEV